MAEDQEVEVKSKKKLIIIIGIIVFVFLLIGGGATYYLLDMKRDLASNTPKLPDNAIYVKLKTEKGRKTFVNSVKTGNDRARLMQVAAEAKLRSKESADALRLHMPVAISRLNTLFGTQDFDIISTYEGKLKMQRDATEVVNDVLVEKEGIGGVENVLFTSLVVQ